MPSKNPPGVVLTPPELAERLAKSLPGHAGGVPAPLLDPACGEGALLLAVLRLRGGDPEFARSSLFGIEVDPERAERCRARLREAAGLPAGTELDEHILCADALRDGLAWPAGTHVLANPPWLSFSGRQAAARSVPGAGRGPDASTAGWPSLHGQFLERIAEHIARARTSAAVLLPAPVAFQPGYGPLRERVERHAKLAAPPVELDERAFEGVTEPAILLTLAPGSAASPSEAPWGRGPDAELLQRFASCPRLPARTFADPGVHSGNAAAELVHATPGEKRAPVRRGKNLRAYELLAADTFLRTDLEPTPALRFRVGSLERYAEFPVLLRQTASRPIAALHSSPTYFRNSLLAMRRVPGLDPAFCVAVLNSELAGRLHRAAQHDARQRSFPQVKVGHLAALPFPIATRDEAAAQHDRIAELVRALEPGDADFDLQKARLSELVEELYLSCCRRRAPSSRTS